jgi:hypothetical protein
VTWSPPPNAVWRYENNVTPLNAAGNGSGEIRNNNAATMMVIVQLSVITAPTSSGCTCVVTPPTGIVDTSYFAGTGDVAGGEPHFLMPGDSLKLTWSSGPANGQGIATYYYWEVRL